MHPRGTFSQAELVALKTGNPSYLSVTSSGRVAICDVVIASAHGVLGYVMSGHGSPEECVVRRASAERAGQGTIDPGPLLGLPGVWR